MSDKQRVIDALQHMPEKATLSEISASVVSLAAKRSGETAADVGQLSSHEEVCRKIRAIRGSLSHVPGSTDDFLTEKHAEADLET